MTTKKNKNTLGVLILAFIITIQSFSQTEKTEARTFENTTTRIEKEKVPFLITYAFYKENTKSKNTNWYGYPKQDINANWFNYSTITTESEMAMYYMLEFTNDTVLKRVTYNALGEIIKTHKNIDTEIQTNIATAIIKSKYKNWKITNEKEELFRDLDLDALIIYKVEIQKGNEKRFLFYSENGLLIKDEEINF